MQMFVRTHAQNKFHIHGAFWQAMFARRERKREKRHKTMLKMRTIAHWNQHFFSSSWEFDQLWTSWCGGENVCIFSYVYTKWLNGRVCAMPAIFFGLRRTEQYDHLPFNSVLDWILHVRNTIPRRPMGCVCCGSMRNASCITTPTPPLCGASSHSMPMQIRSSKCWTRWLFR